MGTMIKVGMADLKVCSAPDDLTTLGLGSCIGCCLYDPVKKIIGMVHFMLPDSTKVAHNENIAKFGDTGVVELVRQMVAQGALKTRLVAKIAGGACMFKAAAGINLPALSVGEKNIESVKEALKKQGIKILAEDTGLNYGRTIEFLSATGDLVIKAVGKTPKTI